MPGTNLASAREARQSGRKEKPGRETRRDLERACGGRGAWFHKMSVKFEMDLAINLGKGQ